MFVLRTEQGARWLAVTFLVVSVLFEQFVCLILKPLLGQKLTGVIGTEKKLLKAT